MLPSPPGKLNRKSFNYALYFYNPAVYIQRRANFPGQETS